MSHAPLTILQLTYQGDGAGSTQSIFNLSQQLARRGHRVLVGCRTESLLARLVAGSRDGLEGLPLDFRRLGALSRSLADVIARRLADVVNSHAPRCRAARTCLGDLGDRPVGVVVSRRKDQDVLLRGLPLVERPVAVACVGLDPDDELLALACAVPERHRVAFVPFVEQPLAYYHLAAFAALPSRIEGFSQGLLEAMALGKPVAASAAGGNPDLITDGETGLLVPPRDAAAWARAVDRLAADRDLAARLARAGRHLLRRAFTLERTADRTEAVYRDAMARR